MEPHRLLWGAVSSGALLILSASNACGDWVEPVSVHSSGYPASAGGGGDSVLPMVSPDGRYVLFSSAARNLVSTGPAQALPDTVPPFLNVYLRDRITGTTILVSRNLTGTRGGDGDSLPLGLSDTGQFVLFESRADDLVSNDTNGLSDVFLRDVFSGVTELISVAPDGWSANGTSRTAVMTPYTRYVAFVSKATDLTSGDTNGVTDVFVRDRYTGTTVLASVLDPGPLFNGGSDAPVMTPDGRYVAFYNAARTSAFGPTYGEIYVRDLIWGATARASTNASQLVQGYPVPNETVSCGHGITDDGRYVVFTAFDDRTPSLFRAGLLLRHDLLTGMTEVVSTNVHVPPSSYETLRNMEMTPDGRCIAFLAVTNATGLTGDESTVLLRWDALSSQTTLISGGPGEDVQPGTLCDGPALSSTGQRIAFLCNATNLATNALTGDWHLYLRDISDGTITLLNLDTNETGSGLDYGTLPRMSAYGNCVAFASPGETHVANDRNRGHDVFVRDLWDNTIELVSTRHPSLPSPMANGVSGWGAVSVSSNARYVAFTSDAEDLVTNDGNGLRDVFVRDLVAGSNILVSVGTNGLAGLGFSDEPSISADGRHVAFSSTASNLTTNDDNGSVDVFVRDLESGITRLASAHYTTNCNSSYSGSSEPELSADGRYLLFTGLGHCLAPPPIVGSAVNGYLRDLVTESNHALTYSGVIDASMSADGRFVAFIGRIYNSSYNHLYVWDRLSSARIYTNTAASLIACRISPGGQHVAYLSGDSSSADLFIADVAAATNRPVSTGVVGATGSPGMAFSEDGSLLTYATSVAHSTNDTNGKRDVYLHDLLTGSNTLVSFSALSGQAGNDHSDSARISPDGRFVAYRSDADDIVPGDDNGSSDLFLHDRPYQSTTLISVNEAGNATANRSSAGVTFSPDSRSLVFRSWASDLVGLDYNRRGDLFLLPLGPPPFADGDLDGMEDSWETDHFGTTARDGQGDFDGDGATDLFEFLTGTRPTDPLSLFRAEVLVSSPPGGVALVTWPTRAWGVYRVQYRDTMQGSDWLTLPARITVVGNSGLAADETPAAGERFYRVELMD